jgi:hypothetical protein
MSGASVVRASLVFLALAASSSSVAASSSCIGGADATALEVASVQQQLMVAALTCGDASRYNNFVVLHRSELQSSDATLLAFFGGHGGSGGYNSFKTRLANVAALESARRPGHFCHAASEAFSDAREDEGLAHFVATQPLALHLPYRVCGLEVASVPEASESRPMHHRHRPHHVHRRHAHSWFS